MLTYVAHPIDQRGPNSWLDAVEVTVADTLKRIGSGAYWPRRGWDLNPMALAWSGTVKAIADVNHVAQRGCAITLAIVPDGVATLGVPSEIERALAWGQPVVLIAGPATRSGVQYAEWLAEGAIPADWEKPGEAIYEAFARHQAEEIGYDILVANRREGSVIPHRHYDGDAGYDLHVIEEVELAPGEYRDISCGFDMALPGGTWGLLIARSSTAQKGLAVNTVVIDQGYTGPMYVGVTNVGGRTAHVEFGDRLAQLVPMPLMTSSVGVSETDTLPPTDRGANGRGSTGA